MVKINNLYTLTNISDCYSVTNEGLIINTITGKTKIPTLGKRGYYYVSLNERNTNRQIKVPLHKIIALAFINNGPYEVINHKDGNKLNNAVENLEFCTQQYNCQHVYTTGLRPVISKVFIVTKYDNSVISGTIKELMEILNIPKGTLYDLYYKHKGSIKYGIDSIIIGN